MLEQHYIASLNQDKDLNTSYHNSRYKKNRLMPPYGYGQIMDKNLRHYNCILEVLPYA